MSGWTQEDEDFAFGRQKKRKFTKEDAIYGVFKGSDSEDSDSDTHKNLLKPMGWVAADEGLTENDIERLDQEDAEQQQMEDYARSLVEESDRISRPVLGGSFVSAKSTPAPGGKATIPPPKKIATFSSSGKNSLQSQPEFEKHTKGVGSRLLEKMGWKPGQGLGREGQGINRPIEVKLRPKNAGLGVVQERTKQQREDFPTEGDMEERARKMQIDEEPAAPQPRAQGWKKKKPKTIYKFAEDEDEEVKEPQRIVITDMRGEKPRTIGSMDEVFQAPPETEYLPELQHNVRLIIDMREAELLQVERKKKAEEDHYAKIKHEKMVLEKSMKDEENQMERIKKVMELITECSKKVAEQKISLESLAKVFLLLQTKYHQEYKSNSLHLLASSFVFPLLKEELDTWKPLENPTGVSKDLKVWKDLLHAPREEEDMEEDEKPEIDAYTQLIIDLILPKIRNALINQWNVKEAEACVDLVDAWLPVLPKVVLYNILDQLIFPKLQREVEYWNPRQDPYPIHTWIHPWLPYLGPELEQFYPIIRQKLAIVLQEWQATDESAHVIVGPWQGVFDATAMENFLMRSIMPKLTQALRSLAIQPHNQQLEPFDAVLSWRDLVAKHHIVNLLEQEFFPKWLLALYNWLTSGANYEEVVKWYSGWKQKFPEDIGSDEKVRRYFTNALMMMNSVLKGQTPPHPSQFTHAPVAPQPQAAAPRKEQAPAFDDLSFKEMIQSFAESHGLFLKPINKRTDAGKQVYMFGKHQVYLDKEAVLRLEGHQWKPVSLDDLIKQ